MPNWDRTPPVSGLSVDEMRRRVADGIATRRKTGAMPRADLKLIKTEPDGPTFDKQQRRVLIQAAELAIYSLANAEREAYCGAADVINSVRRQAGMSTIFMQGFLKGVAAQAAELAGEPVEVLDQLARAWLVEYFTPSGKLISITQGKTNGNGKE